MARLGEITAFGSYEIPAMALVEFHDNFANVVPKTIRLPGMDGGWSEDGTGRAPSQIGQVVVNFYLVSRDATKMDELRDELRAIAEYGESRLTYQPTDGSGERFCWARLQYISDARRAEDQSRVMLKVSAYFQVMYPRWLDGEYLPYTLADGYDLGDGLTFGDNALSIAASGASTSQTIENKGNAEALVAISILPGAGNSCQNPTVQRIVSGAVQDEVKWTGTLNATDELYIDGRRRIVQKNAVDAFGASFSYEHPAFMRLAPGNNTIKVLFANAGDAATVRLWYAHTYI